MKQRDCEAFLDAWLSTEGVGGVRRKGEGSPHVDLIAKEAVQRSVRCGKFASCIRNSEIFSNFLLELEVFTYSSYYCNYKLAVFTRKLAEFGKYSLKLHVGKF